jgi:hypothetical protein
MSCRVPYFELKRDMAAGAAIFRGEIPKRPEELSTNTRYGDKRWDVLLSCWTTDPHHRPECHSVRDMVSDVLYEPMEIRQSYIESLLDARFVIKMRAFG